MTVIDRPRVTASVSDPVPVGPSDMANQQPWFPPHERGMGDDTFYLTETARLFGWNLAVGRDEGTVRITQGPWTLQLDFTGCGMFQRCTATSPTTAEVELTLSEAVAALESPGRIPPTESPTP